MVVDVVDELDLLAIKASYNQEGDGRSAIDPAAMLATLIYAYANNVMSSRQIEIACQRRVEYRWISGQMEPDHTTIARFRQRHSAVFQDLFAQARDLVRRCGLGKAGTIALDGTKLKGDAALDQTKTLKTITKELTEAARIRDLAENARYGKKRGDELPKHLRGAENRHLEDTGLLEPDPVKVRQWQDKQGPSGEHLFAGKPLDEAHAQLMLTNGWQPQRWQAAFHLARNGQPEALRRMADPAQEPYRYLPDTPAAPVEEDWKTAMMRHAREAEARQLALDARRC